MKWNCVILFVILSVINVFGQDDYCYANDGDKKQTKHYSTKTPYEVARGTDKKYFTVPSMSLLTNFHHICILIIFMRNCAIVSECEPVKFWLLSRHGTRNPSAKAIKQLRDLTEVKFELSRFEFSYLSIVLGSRRDSRAVQALRPRSPLKPALRRRPRAVEEMALRSEPDGGLRELFDGAGME